MLATLTLEVLAPFGFARESSGAPGVRYASSVIPLRCDVGQPDTSLC